MDQYYMPANDVPSPGVFDSGLTVDAGGLQDLRTTVAWTKFLAVMGFIFLGIFGLGSFYLMFAATGGYRSSYSAAYFVGQGVALLIVAILYIYPTVQLSRFSARTKAALNTGDQVQFNRSLRHQRNLFLYMGILLIVLLGIYVLIIAVAIVNR